MSADVDKLRELALRIATCTSVGQALTGASNPCRKIVDWQQIQFAGLGLPPDEARRRHHLPEPWAGSLGSARLLFISSNPGFALEDNFPDATWAEKDVVDFFTCRFVNYGERDFGGLDGPTAALQDRSLHKSSDELSAPAKPGRTVPTWRVLRRRAAVILDRDPEQTMASEHYAMTEVVRCKSKQEIGVPEALSTCVERWMLETLALSPARLLVVSGAPAGVAMRAAVRQLANGEQLPSTWGCWRAGRSVEPGEGRWPSSNLELAEWVRTGRWTIADQQQHTVEIPLTVHGEQRVYTLVWMPHPVNTVPQRLDDATLIDGRLLQQWRNVASNS